MTALMINAYEQRQTSGNSVQVYRLFNGFYEGYPGLVIDRYGPTLVIVDHGVPGESITEIKKIVNWSTKNLAGLDSVLLKQRQHPDKQMKNGIIIAGNVPTESISEFGVQYALNLQINQDASFYLDTRNLRKWLLNHMSGCCVLNTFAYTGSLGVAAGAGSAKKVIQTDINRKFLEIAQQSWDLNAFPKERCKILAGDFFRVTGRMRLKDLLFDCVILDPPFFSITDAGSVDLEQETTRLINKVRPLVAHKGYLIVINNALFLSGAAYMTELNLLCKSEYLSLEKIVPIPSDVTGYTNTIVAPPPADPVPFNHPTKIAILKVFRKDQRV
jgi:23S rRNA (cytosine1962-C5)-methyltransferase